MSIKEIYDKMVDIQKNILCYLDNSENVEENYQNLNQLFLDQKIHDNKHDIISLFHLIAQISKYHQRSSLFYDKIIKILQLFEEDIKNYFSFAEIFNIFKSSKRILLFLLESHLLLFDINMIEKMNTTKYLNLCYPQYFSPEINSTIDNKFREKHKYENFMEYLKNSIPNDFYEKRRIGENDTIICELIRKDSVDDFVSFVKENNIQIDSLIQRSIYETNNFLAYEQYINDPISYFNDKRLTLIAYAAAVGSNQIFKYLMDNGAKLDSLWNFAIFGNNLTVIKILEEKKIKKKFFCLDCIINSIKCHHNDIVYYLQSNKNEFNFDNPLKYHNYMLINFEKIKNSAFFFLCKYDYPSFAKIIQQNYDLNINQNIILKFNYFNCEF